MEGASDWASQRKSIYLGAVVLVVTTVCFVMFWKFWYKAPTCTDGVRNGSENGVDCGGACSLICRADVIQPIVRWDPRLFEVLPNVWSVIVYVENPNTDAVAVYSPYRFVIYGADNEVLYERKGVTLLPKNKTIGIFEGSISLPEGKRPRRTLFEFSDNIVWQKNSEEEISLTITHSPLLRLTTTPRVEASIKNNSLKEVKNVELVAAIFDGQDNAIAASRTFVDSIEKDQTAEVFFTWPRPFELGERACTKESNVMLLLDRSGSMASISDDPPEPLTSAKLAAESFVEGLKSGDKIGAISFATEATSPIDAMLTIDFTAVKEAIGKIEIKSDGTQYTNIYEALHSAWSELVSPRVEEGASRVAVLLTDGRATYPRDPLGGKTEEDDIYYAESAAVNEAALLKNDGIDLYTIGLGESINEEFLKQVASKENQFFFAPKAEDLASIYTNISSRICKEVPARIEVTYKILDV